MISPFIKLTDLEGDKLLIPIDAIQSVEDSDNGSLIAALFATNELRQIEVKEEVGFIDHIIKNAMEMIYHGNRD